MDARDKIAKGGTWPAQITRLSFQDVTCIGTLEFPLALPLIVLCGPNGTGKTTILSMAFAALSGLPALASEAPLVTGKCAVDTIFQGAAATWEVDVPSPDELAVNERPFETLYIDASYEVIRQREILGEFPDIDDLINGIGSRPLDASELSEVDFLTKRTYSSVEFYEIDDDDLSPFPFFRVRHGAHTYDSRTMGSGELAAFFLWWSVNRAKPRSIILIEEPETHLSPASQAAFADFLAVKVNERKLCALVTSHSVHIMFASGISKIIYLARNASGIEVVDTPPPPYLANLGVSIPVDKIALVEDLAASIYCRFILEKTDRDLARSVEIRPMSGADSVVAALKAMPRGLRSTTIVGLLDADVSSKITADIQDVCGILPGEPLEVMLRGVARSNADAIGATTGIQDVATIVASLEGADHHDWLIGFAKALGLSLDHTCYVLLSIWYEVDTNRELCSQSYKAFLELIRKS